MSALHHLKRTTCLVAVGSLAAGLCSFPVFAQQSQRYIEEVVVTGTYIQRSSQFDSPSPLVVLGGDELAAQGYTSVSELARYLTINNGSELYSDAFTQNFSTGTGNINLRGLGLSSTLVLVNGRRQTLSGAYSDDGDTFVDTNALMPLIMVERVEVLKDGAAALYGTDAVAGVVNFITRSDFRGFEVEGRFQTTTEDAQEDIDFGAIAGFGNEKAGLVASISYLHRSELTAGQREFTRGSGISASGQPGSFFGLVPGNPTAPVIDPMCAEGINSFPNVIVPASPLFPFDIGTCNFDFSEYYSLVPKEERWQGYATGNIHFTDSLELFLEGGFARNRAERSNTSSFPIAVTVPVPGNHPGNPFPDILWPDNEVKGFLGRVLGGNAPAAKTSHDSDTYRVVGGLRGEIVPRWNWEAAATYSRNEFYLDVEDVVTNRYLAALMGQGGPTGDMWFNPFGTSLNATPDQTGVYNDPAVLDHIIQRASADATTSLWTAEGHVSGILADLPGGELGIAVGGQYRKEKMSYDWSDLYNQEAFLFLRGGPDFGGSRDVYAGFVELAIPIVKNLEIQAAVRYEDYGGGVDTWDPKIAALFRPIPTVTLRGSFGTSFRAPSLFQTLGSQTSLVNINVGANSIFRAARTTGNPDLVPQEADVWNAGLTWQPSNRFNASIDYWRFEYTNLITRENPQGVVDAALGGDPAALAKIEFTGTGDIALINVDFINAPEVKTDGIDLSATYTWPLAAGNTLSLSGTATYVMNYDAIDQNGNRFDGAGSRNFGTFARSIPEWRANVFLTWASENSALTAIVRYIDSYHDNENDVRVDDHMTLDLQYSYSFRNLLGNSGDSATTLTVGVINAFDNDIPRINTFGGYDSKVHDPRGRLVYIGLKQGF